LRIPLLLCIAQRLYIVALFSIVLLPFTALPLPIVILFFHCYTSVQHSNVHYFTSVHNSIFF
jgi:hypothetical protein